MSIDRLEIEILRERLRAALEHVEATPRLAIEVNREVAIGVLKGSLKQIDKWLDGEMGIMGTHTDYIVARAVAQREANHYRLAVAIRKQGGVFVTRFASINDSDYATAEIVTPDSGGL